MTSHLVALRFAAREPDRLARFWAGLLDRTLADDGVTVLAGPSPGFDLVFDRTDSPKVGPNRMHLHLTSTSLEDQRSTVGRALALGGRHIDVGQLPEEGHVVLADPEGNELCVIEPGNAFLAGCGFLGELACDGGPEVGYFWRDVLGWSLVWDQDEETAIQSPGGGTKIAWGGPPDAPKSARNRLSLDLAVFGEGNLDDEVDRLIALGATRTPAVPGAADRVELSDPGGNELVLHRPR